MNKIWKFIDLKKNFMNNKDMLVYVKKVHELEKCSNIQKVNWNEKVHEFEKQFLEFEKIINL